MVNRFLTITAVVVLSRVWMDAGEIRLIPKGSVEIQSIGRSPMPVSEPGLLSPKDKIAVPEGAQAEFHFESGVGGSIGGDAIVLVGDRDSTGWDRIFVHQGSLSLYGGALPLVVSTPVCVVHVFHGPVMVMVEQGVTLVAVQGQQGVVLSTGKGLEKVQPGQWASVGKNSELKIMNGSLPPLDYVEDIPEKRDEASLTQAYRKAVFAQLGLLVVPDMDQAGKLFEQKKFKLHFKSPVDALEKITEMYYVQTRQQSLVSDGKEILFSQLIFSSRDYSKIIPEDLQKLYADGPAKDELLMRLAVADAELGKFSDRERKYVVSLFRQQLVDRLLPGFKIKDQISYNFRETLQYDTNVTQTPDEQQLVSDSDGMSSLAIFGMAYTGRRRNFGEPSIKLGYSDVSYFKEEFANRESSSLSLSVKDSLKLRKDAYINTLSPQLTFSKNYLNTTLGRYNAFDVASPQIQLVFKRIDRPFAMSDYIIFVNTMGYELRNYIGSEQYDFRGEKKDIVAAFFTITGISLKKMESHMAKSTLLFNAKQFASHSSELDYKTIQFNLMHTFDFPKISCDVAYNFNRRWQSIYLALGDRLDLTHTFSFGTKVDFFNRKATFGVNFKHELQDSNIPQFNFIGNQSSMYYSYSF